MKKLVPLLLTATLCFAGGIPSQNIRGEYIEARTADVYTGPCFANSEAGLVGELAVFGWKIDKGSWQGVSLDGLSVVGAVKASATLGDVYHTAYPVKSVLIIDEKASPEQRLALRSFARKMGGDLLQDVVRVDYQPIALNFENNDLHSMKATLTAGTLAVYVPYFYQSGRFLMAPAAMLAIAAAAGVAVAAEALQARAVRAPNAGVTPP